MKILYIVHPETDYQEAILYLGLRQEFGDDNVVDWPYKPSYHGQCDDSYLLPDGKRGFTAPLPWMVASTGRVWGDDEVIAHIGEFDLVVLASPRENNRAKLRELIGRVGRGAFRKFVMIDGEDYDHIRWDYAAEFMPRVYFKREALPEDQRGEHHPVEKAAVGDRVRVVPFQLASVVPLLPEAPKIYDVVFFGGGNYPGGRDQIDRVFRSRLGNRYGEAQALPYTDYLRMLCQARIAIAPRAWSWSALRRWETLSCPGTLLLRDKTPLIEPMPFLDGEHCAYYDSLENAPDVALRYLENEPLRARVALAGNRHLRLYHTAQARARQLVEEAFR